VANELQSESTPEKEEMKTPTLQWKAALQKMVADEKAVQAEKIAEELIGKMKESEILQVEQKAFKSHSSKASSKKSTDKTITPEKEIDIQKVCKKKAIAKD
jgi:hypothetical protein